MSTARPFSSSKLKICILRSRLPSPINHVKPWKDLWTREIHMGLRNISLPQIYAIEFYGAPFPTEPESLYWNRCHWVWKLGATGFSMNPRYAFDHQPINLQSINFKLF
jgi:hypothetical protein